MHPLLNDISTLTLEELQSKVLEINKKLTQSYRLGYGDAVYQLQILLADYQQELQRRYDKQMSELSEKNPEFKSIIDIN
jgi:hypothetical protein